MADVDLKGLSKAQLTQVARDLRLRVASKDSATVLRARINKSVLEASTRSANAAHAANAAVTKVRGDAKPTAAKKSASSRAKAPSGSPTKVADHAANIKAAMAAKDMGAAQRAADVASRAIRSKADAHAFSQAMGMPVKAAMSGKAALANGLAPMRAWASTLSGIRATGGRSAAMLALTVGAASLVSGGNHAKAASAPMGGPFAKASDKPADRQTYTKKDGTPGKREYTAAEIARFKAQSTN